MSNLIFMCLVSWDPRPKTQDPNPKTQDPDYRSRDPENVYAPYYASLDSIVEKGMRVGLSRSRNPNEISTYFLKKEIFIFLLKNFRTLV